MRYILALLLLATSAFATEHYPGEYAQLPSAIQKWFREQRSPGNKIPCCSEADGVFAQEEIRGDHYWTRFTYAPWTYPPGGPPLRGEDHDSEWMQVPDEVVIHGPNPNGNPVVWWVIDGTGLRIRCYSPGAGL